MKRTRPKELKISLKALEEWGTYDWECDLAKAVRIEHEVNFGKHSIEITISPDEMMADAVRKVAKEAIEAFLSGDCCVSIGEAGLEIVSEEANQTIKIPWRGTFNDAFVEVKDSFLRPLIEKLQDECEQRDLSFPSCEPLE